MYIVLLFNIYSVTQSISRVAVGHVKPLILLHYAMF